MEFRISMRWLMLLLSISAILIAAGSLVWRRLEDPVLGMLSDLGLPPAARNDLVRVKVYIRCPSDNYLFSLLCYPQGSHYLTRVVVFDPNSPIGRYYWLDEKTAETCGFDTYATRPGIRNVLFPYGELKKIAIQFQETNEGKSYRDKSYWDTPNTQ